MIEQKIEYIDELIENAFFEAHRIILQNCNNENAAIYLALALRGDIKISNEEGKEAIALLQQFYLFFIRYIHAEILAALFKSTLVIDIDFASIFDRRIRELDFSSLSLGYLVNLLSNYIEVLKVREQGELDAEYLPAVQRVCPLYKLSSLIR